MNDKNILLKTNFDGNKITPRVHAWSCFNDYSLCGLGNCEDFEYTDKKITCLDCITVINYCKSFKKGKHYI